MTDERASAPAEASGEIELRLTRDELDLTRTALRVLLSTLGREEADELEQVQVLLARIAEADPAR